MAAFSIRGENSTALSSMRPVTRGSISLGTTPISSATTLAQEKRLELEREPFLSAQMKRSAPRETKFSMMLKKGWTMLRPGKATDRSPASGSDFGASKTLSNVVGNFDCQGDSGE
jgi:hypothetical protein